MQDEIPAASIEYDEDIGATPAAAIDLFSILGALLRRWKLISLITLSAVIATYGALKLVPSLYVSTVEILVYDPQQQIDASVAKPISPFVDAVGYDAMNTEINIIKSKSVALRVARELGLDTDAEFEPHNLLAELAEWLGLPRLRRADNLGTRIAGGTQEQKAKKLDQAADTLRGSLQVWSESYIIFVSATSQNPIKAQRLASAIASDYLASQREARQEALQRVTTWLRRRVDDLQSRVLETKSSIEKLKAESGINETGIDNISDRQLRELNTQLMTARAEVNEKRARLEQARRVIDTNGDIESIPELTASAVLTGLRQKQVELDWQATELEKKVGERHLGVIALRMQLAGINKQVKSEAEHILGNMKNAYDIAVRQQQALEADLRQLGAAANSEAYAKLQQLRRAADADHTLYESYLSQYNEISERRTLQDASARIISPATLPGSPSRPRRKLFYAIAGISGLGGGLLLAILLEYLRPGVKTSTEIEQSFGRPVVGVIPLVQRRILRATPFDQLLHRMAEEPLWQLSEAVRALRISLELASAKPKAVLITSALPAEGKSTAAMLLAASSAGSGRRTVLLDCDLHQQSLSAALPSQRQPGLSELLRGTAELVDVITKDPAAKTYMISAGSRVPNAADLLMSSRMRDLIVELRGKFDYIVMDTPPLLTVVDALALATIADKILVIVEWGHTPRASISEAFKILRPVAQRVAGIVLNKVDLNQLQGYGYSGYHYRSVGKYLKNA